MKLAKLFLILGLGMFSSQALAERCAIETAKAREALSRVSSGSYRATSNFESLSETMSIVEKEHGLGPKQGFTAEFYERVYREILDNHDFGRYQREASEIVVQTAVLLSVNRMTDASKNFENIKKDFRQVISLFESRTDKVPASWTMTAKAVVLQSYFLMKRDKGTSPFNPGHQEFALLERVIDFYSERSRPKDLSPFDRLTYDRGLPYEIRAEWFEKENEF